MKKSLFKVFAEINKTINGLIRQISFQWLLFVGMALTVFVTLALLTFSLQYLYAKDSQKKTEDSMKIVARDWYKMVMEQNEQIQRIFRREDVLAQKRLVDVTDLAWSMLEHSLVVHGKEHSSAWLFNYFSKSKIEYYLLDNNQLVIDSDDKSMIGKKLKSFSVLGDKDTETGEEIVLNIKTGDDIVFSSKVIWETNNGHKVKTLVAIRSLNKKSYSPYTIVLRYDLANYKSFELEKQIKDRTKDLISKELIGKFGYIWVLDSKGNYIVSRERLRDGEGILDTKTYDGVYPVREILSIALKLKKGETGFYSYKWKNLFESKAKNKIAAIVYVPEWDWIIGPSSYEEDFLDNINFFRMQMLLIGVFALCVSLIIGYFLSRWVTKPIKKIGEVVARYQHGEKSLKIEINELGGSKELSILSTSFNEMMTNIARQIDAVKESKDNVTYALDVLQQAELMVKIGNFERNWQTGEGRYSSGFKRLLGLDSTDAEPSHEEFLSFIHEQDRARVVAHIKETIINKTKMDIEFRLVKKGGRVIDIHGIAENTYDSKGSPLKTIGTFQDITERKLEQEQTLSLQAQLQQSQKLESIGTLAAGIAHEINTPIQFVSDNASFLGESVNKIIAVLSRYRHHCNAHQDSDTYKEMKKLEQEKDIDFLLEEMPKAIEESKQGLSKVSIIVTAMKSFSHVKKTDKQYSDINKAISDTAIITRNEWKYHSELKLQLDEGLPLVMCHIIDIQQVIMNLIINATHAVSEKFASKEKGEITIKTFYDDTSVLIQISDNGAGIPEKIKSKVFDQFITTKAVGKGTGQGLSIAYSTIVEVHNGTIRFESTEGKGTTFYITLPR